MNFLRQIQVALEAAPPLNIHHKRILFGCCRRLTAQQLRIRVKQFLRQYPEYKPYLDPVVNAWTGGP